MSSKIINVLYMIKKLSIFINCLGLHLFVGMLMCTKTVDTIAESS